jgi:MFS transporter, MHS family, proline/betaine transporter
VSQALHNARSEPATGAPASGRALVAACAGNLVEWYDFAVYGAFATVIAATFFPGSDPSARLLASFAVFATAFLVRPFGALLFGRLGDRVGRRPVLATVIVLMAAATAGIGLLPSYATIGMLAPLLLTLLRSAQGLSVGGESSGATAFVVEYAPEGRRGWYGAWLWATLAFGVACGIGMAVLLARVLTRATLEGWGWRLAFLVTLPLGLVGLYLRRRLDETPRFRAVQRARVVVRRPVAEAVRGYPGRLLTGLALVAIAAPFLGRLSDRVGRRPLLVAGTLALLVVTLPAFLLIRGAAPSGLPLGYVLVGLPLSCLVIVPPFLAELFPTPIRSTALAITYGVGSALFGGTAPFLATLLVRRTGNPVTPAFYAVAVAVVAVVAALLTREIAFRPLDTD